MSAREEDTTLDEAQENYPCYGKAWDAESPICQGGLTYTKDAQGDDHWHTRCPLFDPCTVRVRSPEGPPRSSVILPPPPPMPPMTSRPIPPPEVRVPLPSALTGRPAMIPPPTAPSLQPPTTFPSSSNANPYGIPPYLSTPEPLYEDESILRPLLREVLRGAVKSVGHTAASFADRVPLGQRLFKKKKRPPPEE